SVTVSRGSAAISASVTRCVAAAAIFGRLAAATPAATAPSSAWRRVNIWVLLLDPSLSMRRSYALASARSLRFNKLRALSEWGRHRKSGAAQRHAAAGGQGRAGEHQPVS